MLEIPYEETPEEFVKFYDGLTKCVKLYGKHNLALSITGYPCLPDEVVYLKPSCTEEEYNARVASSRQIHEQKLAEWEKANEEYERELCKDILNRRGKDFASK